MGCGNCGSGSSGKPGGCKGNGGCDTGGCNRMNVFDWLSGLPLHDSAKPYPIIEVTFNKGSRKDFYRNNTSNILEKGEWITVEGVSGYDVGQVSVTGELVKLQMKKYGVEDNTMIKRVLRMATDEDINNYYTQKDREAEMLIRSRAISRSLNLDMKLCEVELQADGKKGTFFYTADQRVDFRELIKLYAGDFRLKVEMKQIGARQESGKVGGIGSCGRELCCSTWLTDFKSVNTTAARYQNLSINQTKLSGQCGRLKCCLNYELDTYMDSLRIFPDHAEVLQTVKGNATLQKRDIFKSLMWYSYSDSSKQYPLTITRVKEIQALNKDGQKAEELQPVELETRANKAGIKVDMGYVNDVGQLNLKALEKGGGKKKKGGSSNKQLQATPNPNREGNRPQRPNQGQRANQPERTGQPQQKRQQPEQDQTSEARPKQQQPQKQGQSQQRRERPQQKERQQPQQREGQSQQSESQQAQGPQKEGQQPQQREGQPNRQQRNRGRDRNRPQRPEQPQEPKPDQA